MNFISALQVLVKGQSGDKLWPKIWGPHIFYETITSNRFKESKMILQFDMKSTQAMRLKVDKFALVLSVEDCFI